MCVDILHQKLDNNMEIDDNNHNISNTNTSHHNHNNHNENDTNINKNKDSNATNANANNPSKTCTFPHHHPNIIKRNKLQTKQRFLRIVNERKTNGYSQSDFKLTDNGDFYNQYVEQFIYVHADPYIEIEIRRSPDEDNKNEGNKKTTTYSISSGQLAMMVDNDRSQSII